MHLLILQYMDPYENPISHPKIFGYLEILPYYNIWMRRDDGGSEGIVSNYAFIYASHLRQYEFS